MSYVLLLDTSWSGYTYQATSIAVWCIRCDRQSLGMFIYSLYKYDIKLIVNMYYMSRWLVGIDLEYNSRAGRINPIG